MERTTVYLDEDIRKKLKLEASARGVAEAEIIREALRKHLSSRPRGLPRVVGCSRDGGVARDLDEALEELGFARSPAV
jgi:hypothetical protein